MGGAQSAKKAIGVTVVRTISMRAILRTKFKNLPGCLFIRTFLLKSSYTLLRMLKCLKLYAWNCMWDQDTPDFMEISSYPCNCIIFIIKVINYALWRDIRLRVSVTCTFTIKHGTHVPIATCSHLYDAHDYTALLTPLIAKACVVQWLECRTPDSGAESSNHGVGWYFFF